MAGDNTFRHTASPAPPTRSLPLVVKEILKNMVGDATLLKDATRDGAILPRNREQRGLEVEEEYIAFFGGFSLHVKEASSQFEDCNNIRKDVLYYCLCNYNHWDRFKNIIWGVLGLCMRNFVVRTREFSGFVGEFSVLVWELLGFVESATAFNAAVCRWEVSGI